jgi:hypothetical protein
MARYRFGSGQYRPDAFTGTVDFLVAGLHHVSRVVRPGSKGVTVL